MARLIVSLLLVFVGSSSTAWAVQPPSLKGLYGDLHFAFSGVRHSDIEFNPGFASLSAGVWLWDGIGLEAFVDRGLNPGNEGEFELEITDANGVALRFQGEAEERVFAYVVLGVVATRLEQIEADGAGQRTVVQNYRGGRISIGLGTSLTAIPGARILAEYRNYFVDEDLQMDAVSLGFQVNFQ